MKYLITGGCGFIGSNLVEYLNTVDKGSEIVIVDNLVTGKKENVANLDVKKIYMCDVREVDSYKAELADTDVIYHLAACASVEMSVNNTLYTINNNVISTITLFDIVKQINPDIKIIQASSAAVYGNVEGTDMISENNCLKPLSPYAIDKMTCEYYADVYNNTHNMNITTVRPFNIYGKNQNFDSHYSGVITIFAHLLNESKSLTVFGDGKNTRDYVYIKDFVRALYILRNAKNEIYNIGSGIRTTTNAVIDALFVVMNKTVDVKYEDPRIGDVLHSLANVEKLKLLGFECEYSLLRGVSDYFKEEFN